MTETFSRKSPTEDEKIIKLLQGLLNHFTKEKSSTTPKNHEPLIIPRAEHSISRKSISENALKVLSRLNQAGFSAYLVGGCVRDLLLGHQPKDYDIATSAHPEQVRKLFRNSRLIGKRFRLAHIVFGKELIEVATFRTHHKEAHAEDARSHKGMIVRDNVYGTIEDDVWRRDFSINALYYNIADFSIVDYADGMQDIKTRTLRIIGNPELRYQEDPVRLLRAVRFMGKLHLKISPETETPIIHLSHLLGHVSSARLFQEVLKFFKEGATLETVKLLQKYNLFAQLFPPTATLIHLPETKKLIEEALANTDKRIKENKSVSPAFLFAVFLWHPVLHTAKEHEESGMPFYVAAEKALRTVLHQQTQRLAITRHLQLSVREICLLQYRFSYRHGARAYRLVNHPRFRAAYDLLALRATVGDPVQELSTWWDAFSTADHELREKMIKELEKKPAGKKRRRRKK